MKAEKISTHDKTQNAYFPESLYNMTFSFKAQHELFFIDAILVSKSDKPFYSKNEIRPGLFAFYNFLPSGNSPGGLYAGFIYFPFDSILPWNIPFPFLNYQYFSKELTVMIGIPFLIRWNILPYLGLNLFYLPVANVRASVDFYFSPLSKISLEGAWWSENFSLAKREKKEEKLYFETMRAGLKYSKRIFYIIELSLFGGRTFSVDYFKGEDFSDRWQKKELKNSWVIEAAIKTIF